VRRSQRRPDGWRGRDRARCHIRVRGRPATTWRARCCTCRRWRTQCFCRAASTTTTRLIEVCDGKPRRTPDWTGW